MNRIAAVDVLFFCIYLGDCESKLTEATVRDNTSPKPIYERFNIDNKILEATYSDVLEMHNGRRVNSKKRILHKDSHIWDWDTWCLLQAKEGNCNQKIKRFYYNSQLDECLPFFYSGCNANENNFLTKLDCELRCSGETPMLIPSGKDQYLCQYQPDVGACFAFETQYFFDVNRNTCLKFVYGGCGGYANRFKTKFKCMRTCKQQNE